MPQMPTISMPGLDEPFYTPSIPSFTPKNGKGTASTDEEDNDSEVVLSDATNSDDLLKKLLKNNNLLTASDISSLYDFGLFGNISSLSGTNVASSTNTSTDFLLQQMLTSLEDLKKEQKNATEVEKEQLLLHQQDSQNFKSREPSILRFKINGYSIKDSLTETFFSETEKDGSFLLTADRKYFVNQQPRTETFYLLFKTIKSNGSVTTYEVIPSIAQDNKNTNSFVYKFCQQKNIVAEKTGNLVVLHYEQNGVTADMLLDIDN